MPKRRKTPSYRFYALYDKLYREDVLRSCLPVLPCERTVRRGWMARRFEDIEAYGVERWLGELAKELKEKDVSAASGPPSVYTQSPTASCGPLGDPDDP